MGGSIIWKLHSIGFLRALRRSHQAANHHPPLHTLYPNPAFAFIRQNRYVNGFSGPNPGQVGPQGEVPDEPQASGEIPRSAAWSPTMFKMLESAATTFASILILA